ncbi:TonB-dependent receptor [Lutimonas halocynthiae]|uniref:TonB-dependent receptor n=1 Tax=Lutimonas halocynthiae TaxID=1446477 RepID=UPI0025B621BF|nr:TonB-dependent receptor [Lutimonas halocynthiae]MDN3644292.1 TonB-dependent receptor [Lutimonas halocynthiae]
MKRYTFYLLLIMTLLLSKEAWSQNSIKGTILDDIEAPVLGADIYIEQLHIGTTSDENGMFQLQNIPQGSHKLSISFIGFNTENVEVNLVSSDIELNISLIPSVFHMDEVIVSAPFNKLQSENVMKIESKSIESLRKTGAPTLMQSISSIAGVSEITTGTGIGKPVIRGLSGNRVLVYTQGVRLENQQFGNEHGLGMNDSGIESVEVIKGPASLLYGSDALGGVLYLNPEKFAYQNETKIEVNQNFYSNTLGSNTSVGLKTSKDRLKLIFRGGYNSHADYEVPDGNRVTNSRFNEKDFKAGIGLNLDQFVTEFRYNYNQSEIGIPEEIGEQTESRSVELPYQDLETHILSLHNHFYLKNSKIDFNLGYIVNNRKEFEDEHGHNDDEHEDEDEHEVENHEGAALDMNLKTLSYDLKYNFAKKGKFETIAGVQGMFQNNKNFGEEILIPDARINDIGFLATSTFEINEKNSLQGGIRFDYRYLQSDSYEIEEDHDEIEEDHDEEITIVEGIEKDYNNFTFSLGYKSLLFNSITTRINLASGFRAPNLAELTSYGVHHGTNRFEIGNADLESEQNFQTDISLEYGNQHFEIYANGFYNKLNNYIFAQPTGETIDEHDVYEYVQNDAKLYGGEFGFHLHPHPFDWLHLESSFETVIGEQDNGDYLPLIPANKWANTIRTEIKGLKKFNEIYTAIILDSYFEQDKVSEFETTTPSYNLLHLRMGGNLSFNKMDLGINLSFNNLLDETYTSHLSILKADMIPNPGRNIVLGLNFKFL